MTGPMTPLVITALSERFTLHRLWEAPDPQARLAEIGPAIRGLASSALSAPADEALFAKLPALEIVSSLGVGYDNVEVAAAAARGIVVTNTPDVLTDEVADLTIGLLLATLRRLPQADRFLRAGRWLEEGHFSLTPTLRGRRVGILGYGRIGKAIAHRLDAFGVEVVYHGRNRQEGVPHAYFGDLAEMASAVDVLVAVTPGGPGTDKIIDARVLDALGPDGVLINVARGSVVDEEALIAALRDGRILSAGLDVYADEPNVPQALIDMEHVVLLPHVGSGSQKTRDAMAQLVVDNLVSWFEGRGPLTPVPETPYRA
ncbi:MAG: 2-hydroxyacid dehydrogenase [Salinarimonadaceae bacterium]|nr:MAG: 2-hydroxyacid dehydrogenase [Salinarimonadaceae bacterium]